MWKKINLNLITSLKVFYTNLCCFCIFLQSRKPSQSYVSEMKQRESTLQMNGCGVCIRHNGARRESEEKRKLFTTREDCLVHVKLWPAVHCLWCPSFNRLVDIMNEPDPPSATPKRTPALSELRSTLEPLSQSRRSSVAKCRPERGRAENFCFLQSLMKLAWSLKKGLKENLVSLSCDCWRGNSSAQVTVWTGWSQFRAAPGGIWLVLLLLYWASGALERVFSSTICCRHLQHIQRKQQVDTWDEQHANIRGERGATSMEPTKVRPHVPSIWKTWEDNFCHTQVHWFIFKSSKMKKLNVKCPDFKCVRLKCYTSSPSISFLPSKRLWSG